VTAHDLKLLREAKPAARRDRPERDAGGATPHRERGLWSFLTWSFFLSQLLAAQQLIGAAANSAEAAEDPTASSDAATAEAMARQAALSM
jgi:hypothetical protein